jgi:type VI secretion system secreted protein VgrG
MRVAQAWAGTGWGAQFIPRIGMEVIVTFLGGDVDRPLITGCVPNAINVPAFPLPGSKTKSGFRTQSTPGGGGYNELSFEDAKGEEVICLRAQRDLDEKILWNQTTAIGHNRHLRVGASLDEQIALDHASTVSGDRRETVRGAAQFSAGGERFASVGTNDIRHVVGNDCTIIAGNAIHNVSGMLAEHVQQGYTLGVKGHYDVHIGEHDAPKHGTVFASGNYRIIAGKEAVLHAERSLTLTCGTSTITLSPDGITIKAASVTLEGSKVLVRGDGPEIRVGQATEIVSDKIHLQAKDAAIDLERDVRIDGKMVKLNCGPDRIKANKEGEEAPTHAIIRVLQHLTDTPCERMNVTVANAKGETREYLSGSDGTIRVEFSPEEKSTALRVVSMRHADDDDRTIHLSDIGRS